MSTEKRPPSGEGDHNEPPASIANEGASEHPRDEDASSGSTNTPASTIAGESANERTSEETHSVDTTSKQAASTRQ